MVFSTTTSARKPSGIVTRDRYAFVNDGHGDLGFESDAGMAQFQGHALGVHRFQQAWANRAMDLNGEADNPFREGLVFEHEELPWCAVVLGVLRGEDFKSVNRHEQRCPTTRLARRPDPSIRGERRRSGWQSVLSQMRLPCL
jgi:hypothetical protein